MSKFLHPEIYKAKMKEKEMQSNVENMLREQFEINKNQAQFNQNTIDAINLLNNRVEGSLQQVGKTNVIVAVVGLVLIITAVLSVIGIVA